MSILKRMDRVIEDALNIQRLLPWIESEEDIINYLRRIPLDQNHLRSQLAIVHFLNLKDGENKDNSEQEIENDAREIVLMLPDTAYRMIKERLRILGNMPNRKEVIVRQLLGEKNDLRNIVSEIDHNNVSKRKCDIAIDNSDESNATNIRIKISKLDGSLKVVSSIKQEIIPVSPKSASKIDVRTDLFNKESSSSVNEITSSSDSDDASHSSRTNESPVDVERNNTFQFVDHREKQTNQLPGSSKPATVVSATMTKETCCVINNVDESRQKFVKPEEPEEHFNLIGYLREVTQADENKITALCKEFRVSLDKRPCPQLLNDLLNKILNNDDVILLNDHDDNQMIHDDLILLNNDDSVINLSDTVSTDDSAENASRSKESAKIKVSKIPVILRPPKLIVPSDLIDCQSEVQAIPTHEPLNLSPSKRNFIQPARLIIESERTVPNVEAGPSTSNHKTGPSTSNHNSGPSTSNHNAGPSTSTHNTGPSTSNDNAGPSTVNNNAGPSTSNYQACPSTSNQQVDIVKFQPKEEISKQPSCTKKKRVIDEKLVLRLIEIFPEACPDYIRGVCDHKNWSEFDNIVSVILSNENYPRRQRKAPSPPKEVNLEEQLEMVKAMLPDADPTFLRCKCEAIGKDSEQLNEFILTARETGKYPTMKEYLRKQKLTAQSKQYTTEFKVDKFVKLFPEPDKTFMDPKRKPKVDNYTCLYMNNFFQNKYPKLSVKTIRTILSDNDYRIMASDMAMSQAVKMNQVMKTRRKPTPWDDIPQNIMVLQELAYITHKEEIDNFIKAIKEKEELDRRHAKESGLMNTCECCFDDEVMPKDIVYCPSECKFCRDCIKKSCEVALGEGKTEFRCLNDCPEEFTLQTLQNVLPPKMFSKLAQKKTLAEVQAAGIEELEMCPFCDFATIPNENDKIFRCLNADCMKESCRQCREENHIPYRCDEVEKDADVKARVYVENKMTEALLRKCWKCGTSFFKEEGCNKMTCTCGAKMCYVCKKPVEDYKHFNGLGGDKHHLCPLYSDTNLLNQQNVLGAAEAAKAEVDPTKLKIDPTVDVRKHYDERKKTLPKEPHLHVINNFPHQHRMQPNLPALNEMVAMDGQRQIEREFIIRLDQERRLEQVRRDIRLMIQNVQQNMRYQEAAGPGLHEQLPLPRIARQAINLQRETPLNPAGGAIRKTTDPGRQSRGRKK